ncbi:hypothetical protein AB833_23355 [Chromatiales bacterium (ex Bugula neritina AB1)]|nr:hypothetical protein AB833_23355 [Chromatiales bacterium (ex Bugula neritina AB1)]
MFKFFRLASVLGAILVATSGCDATKSTPATYDAESYSYKGAADPLLNTSGADRAGELGSRFDLVQGRQ